MIKEAILRINEVNLITIYHGDNFGTKRLKPELMMNGNVQEGIGIYFGALEVAQTYGKDVVYVEVNPKNFIPARDTVRRKVKLAYKILRDLWKIDNEAMYYLISDWMEIIEPEDITRADIEYLATKMGEDEVRNFQITLAESFGVENFVKIWNKIYPKNLGTYNDDTGFYAILNPKVFPKPYIEDTV